MDIKIITNDIIFSKILFQSSKPSHDNFNIIENIIKIAMKKKYWNKSKNIILKISIIFWSILEFGLGI